MPPDMETPRPGQEGEAHGAHRVGDDRGQATAAYVRGRHIGRGPDVADMRAELLALGAPRLCEALGLPAHRSGGHLRSRRCPCRDHRDPDFAINTDTLMWSCFGATCDRGHGDAIDLVGRCRGTTAFPDTLAEVADLVGWRPCDASDAERAQRRADAERLRRERDDAAARQKSAERVEARRRAAAYWATLWLRDAAGGLYLRDRGIGDLVGRGAVVRIVRPGWRDRQGRAAFGSHASANAPAVLLRDLDGAPLSVTCRRAPEQVAADGGPKTPTMLGCPTDGTLVGSVVEVVAGSLVVVPEGVFDTLTACLAWPDAVVLGAAGAGRYAFVAMLAARRLREVGGGRLLVADADPCSQRALADAIAKAREVGVERGGRWAGTCDLNAAWCAGWRP
ncbi:MAG: hypothetical protein R2939_22350 [Kofleriaceae bacterium]